MSQLDELGPHLDALRSRALPGGGFAASPRYPDIERPDATAWAILALRLHGSGADELRRARTSLAAFQDQRGAVTLYAGSFAIVWPTPLAALAWFGDRELAPAAESAVGFLLGTGGVPLAQAPELGHDMSLRGWSWVLGTHSWVEPTSLGLMALRLHGQGGHQRAVEAEELLFDRCLPSGGWNYGNTLAFGAELLPTPDSTGVALAALSDPRRANEKGEPATSQAATSHNGAARSECVARSTAYLEAKWQSSRTPLALGWSLLGLSARGRRPKDAIARVVETLDRQQQIGPYDTALLGLTLAAAAAEHGLLASLSATHSETLASSG